MDCEKCEELLLDELYGELDDVTGAAVRRHVAGCARCSAIFSDLKSTREMVSSFPIVAVPPSLEERIFAAEKESKKVVQLRGFSRFVSVAGRWAMRPQTAMAALFLLMIGSTTFFLKGRSPSRASAPIVVAQEGSPMNADQSPSPTPEALAPNAARGAHGPLEPKPQMTPPPMAAAASAAPAATTTTALAVADLEKAKDSDDSNSDGRADKTGAIAAAKPRPVAHASRDPYGALDEEKSMNASTPAGAPMPQAMNAPPAPPPPPPPQMQQALGNGAAGGGNGYYPQQQPGNGKGNFKKEDTGADGDAFTQGSVAYRSGQYPVATQQFDRAAQSGDLNASLWSARSTRQAQGCAAAVPKFDAVAARAAGTQVGADARLESAQCSAQLGQAEAARAKYTQLLTVQTHAARAQQALDNMNQVATRRANEAPAPAKKAAAPIQAAQAAPQPAPPPATAPATATDSKK